MTKLIYFLAIFIGTNSFSQSFDRQQGDSTKSIGLPRSPNNPTIAHSQIRSYNKSDLRIQRLNTLAEIWWNLALHHSKLVGKEKEWDSVLTQAIPQVEKTKSPGDFASVLNTYIFSYLNDPFSYASVFGQRPDSSLFHIDQHSFYSIKLATGIAYLSIPAPADYNGNLLQGIYESFQKFGTIDRLVIDLRTDSKNEYNNGFLSLWADRDIPVSPTVTPVYWYYHVGGQYWLTKGNSPLEPIKQASNNLPVGFQAIRVPTVFIVNNNSYPPIAAALDALQKQPNVAVLFDNTGPQTRGNLFYTENLSVSVNSDMLLAYDGGLGASPDTTLKNIPLTELASLSGLLLSRHQTHKSVRSPFTYAVHDDYRPPSLPSLTREQKILGLMKIWVAVKYFYAYPEHLSADWNNLLFDWIPAVERTKNSSDYYRVLQEVTSKIHDNHVWFEHPSLALLPDAPMLSKTIPALLLKVQGKVIVAQIDSTATGPNFPLSVGDEIVAVDGKTIAETEAFWRKSVAAAQESGFIRNVWEYAFAVRGSKDSMVSLTVIGKNGKKNVRLKKSDDVQQATTIHPFGRKLIELLPGNIGYIRLYHIPTLAVLDSAFTRFKDTRGLILDLRGCNAPYNYKFNADMRKVLVDRLVKDPFERSSFRIFYHFTDDNLPVNAAGDQIVFYFPDSSGKPFYDKPVVIITSSRQQSYGEGVLQILQAAKRVTFVGSPTVGTNGGMEPIKLPDGGMVTFTMMYTYQPQKTPFHGVGIIPDVRIEPTINGIKTRKDEVLDKAIETLKKKIKQSL
jgi:C-terminal processing protease CtpA/Prc